MTKVIAMGMLAVVWMVSGAFTNVWLPGSSAAVGAAFAQDGDAEDAEADAEVADFFASGGASQLDDGGGFLVLNDTLDVRLTVGNPPSLDILPGARLTSALVEIQEVRLVWKRPNDLADEVYVLSNETRRFTLLDGENPEMATVHYRVALPDVDLTEIQVTFSDGQATVLADVSRELPLAVQDGPVTGRRMVFAAPIQVRRGQRQRLNLELDLAESLSVGEHGRLVLDPMIRLDGAGALAARETLPDLGLPTVSPGALRAGETTDVDFTVEVSGPTVDPTTVRLARVLAAGGSMHVATPLDAGQPGDDEADDAIFSARVSMTEPAGRLFFRAEAFTTAGEPVASHVIALEVFPDGVPITPAGYADLLDDAVFDVISDEKLIPGRLLLSVAPDMTFADMTALVGQVGGTIIGQVPELRLWQVALPDAVTADDVWVAAIVLRAIEDRVEVAAPEFIFEAAAVTPTDTIAACQQILNDVSVRAAWGYSRGRTGIRIGVLDSGISTINPDISPRVVFGRDWVTGGALRATDRNGHGTNVAGLLGAVSQNGFGIAGVTWVGSVVSVKVLDGAAGRPAIGPHLSVVAGVIDAVNRSSRVLNMSFASTGSGTVVGQSKVSRQWRRVRRQVRQALKNPAQWVQLFVPILFGRWLPTQLALSYAHSRNRLTVAAAGNQGFALPVWPASLADVSVASTTPPSVIYGSTPPAIVQLSSFSNFVGRNSFPGAPRIAAPGEQLFTTTLGPSSSNFSCPSLDPSLAVGNVSSGIQPVRPGFQGTSASTAVVSGVAELVWAIVPLGSQHSRLNIRRMLLSGAFDGGGAVFRPCPQHPSRMAIQMPFRQVDAAETFNTLWTTQGPVTNQQNPGNVFHSQLLTCQVTRAWQMPGAAVGLLCPFVTAGQGVWWFGSPCTGSYIGASVPPPQMFPGQSLFPAVAFLTSPVITLVNSPNPVVHFNTWFEIEAADGDTHDLMEVVHIDQVTGVGTIIATLNPAGPVIQGLPGVLRTQTDTYTSGGVGMIVNPPFQVLLPPVWTNVRIDLSNPMYGLTLANPFKIEFRFDTRDTKANAGMGWVIDEFRIFDWGVVPLNMQAPSPHPTLPFTPGAVPRLGRTLGGGC